ncbi:hypothetical protein PG997_012093 [Apiospora hydei]|uniref:Uncharacterized protein n=1 Tax=Apiospora hydei TaxID=1337664 RepID=A0ABR1V4V8_9PEZI
MEDGQQQQQQRRPVAWYTTPASSTPEVNGQVDAQLHAAVVGIGAFFGIWATQAHWTEPTTDMQKQKESAGSPTFPASSCMWPLAQRGSCFFDRRRTASKQVLGAALVGWLVGWFGRPYTKLISKYCPNTSVIGGYGRHQAGRHWAKVPSAWSEQATLAESFTVVCDYDAASSSLKNGRPF